MHRRDEKYTQKFDRKILKEETHCKTVQWEDNIKIRSEVYELGKCDFG